ncbi:centrosomal protein of 68 kDa [Discoglossus pictus]
MDFTRRKTSSSRFRPLNSTSHTFVSEAVSSNDVHEQDRTKTRTLLESSWGASCGNVIPHPHNKANSGEHKTFQLGFKKTNETEEALKKSNFQEQYWACAIPASLPPCPDRNSPRWDPNKEYLELLDYTYPLNPKYFLYKDSVESETDPFFHDSGIDLDSYNLSYDTKLHSVNPLCEGDLEERKWTCTSANYMGPPHAFSTPVFKRPLYQTQKSSDSSNEASFEELSPYVSKVDLAKESTHSFNLLKCSEFEKYNSTPKRKVHKPGQFIPTTKVLPRRKHLECDEEYLSLPSHLKEIEVLATHLKDISLSVDKNSYLNCEQDKHGGQNWLSFECSENQEGRNAKKTDGTMHRNPLFESNVLENKSDSQEQSDKRNTLSRFSCLRDMLDGLLSSDSLGMTGDAQKDKENKTLVQSIQSFCHHLDTLIQWLYGVAEITESWTPPKPDVESIQLALSLYLKFKKDVAEHQSLADTVVKDGELLLRYLSLNSSVLKDTLVLISKQSEELDRHAERLYASVLEAMDTVTDDSLGRSSNLKQCVTVEME